MVDKLEPPSPEALARIRALAERRLSADEVEAGLRARLNDAELEEARALIRWFCRRYPTPEARLAYARRAYAQQARSIPPGLPGGGRSR